MAKVSFVLDKRRAKVCGLYPLKAKVTHDGGTAYVPMDVDLRESEWDDRNKMVVNRNDRNKLNAMLFTKMSEYEDVLERMPKRCLSAGQVRDYMVSGAFSEKFVTRFRHYMDNCETEGCRRMYGYCLSAILKFDPYVTERTFDDIDRDWLVSFDKHMAKTMGVNTRSMRMRCVRAVFNDAIANDITDNYPFRKFKIRQEETRKRSLSVDQLRTLRDYPCADWQVEYRDMFMLMFYLGGINAADLFQASRSSIVNGRLEYRRQKTHRLYSVKIEPEAMEILERYKGKRYLLPALDRFGRYEEYLHHMNNALKSIGRPEGKRGKILGKGLFPDLSSYWSRHTIATLASEIDVPIDTISLILGHSFGNSTTQIYIRHDPRKADEAVRRVIDYVNSSGNDRT